MNELEGSRFFLSPSKKIIHYQHITVELNKKLLILEIMLYTLDEYLKSKILK